VISTNVRRLGTYLLLGFAVVSASLAYWQVVDAPNLEARPDNPELISAVRSQPRGSIFDATDQLLASTTVTDELARRTYSDPHFTHVIGYASLRFGTTELERAWNDVLIGRGDPNPVRDLVSEILDRSPVPKDLTLTLDRRLQDAAGEALGGAPGAVVALDPRTGAVLAMVSSPTVDASALTADPDSAAGPMEQLQSDPARPLLPRAREGRYVPGSIIKVFTAAAALDSGAITPETTFADQPREETEGFVVSGFRITEHGLGGIQPGLWDLSPALQVSSNIYFAHVGLELGPERFLDYARRFGFCEPMAIGPAGRQLDVATSLVTPQGEESGCSAFGDDAELASAAFGQGRWFVTPVQMALLAATIANDGRMPDPFVVRSVRQQAGRTQPSGSPEPSEPPETVLEQFDGDGGRSVVSAETARQVRSAMVDAVHGELGRFFAGEGNVELYGVSGVRTAGKTGTAQLGGEQAPHSWFIGFAPAGPDAQPEIAIAVLVESGGPGSTGAAPLAGRLMAQWLQQRAGEGD
jgi:peptidoglycan glycosyltransferase